MPVHCLAPSDMNGEASRRLVAGWLPVVLRRAKAARFGADHASLIFVAVILVACSDDADGTLLNLTVIRTGWPAATRTG